MESLVKLFYAWEIELFVLLSFTLQVYLFFTGSLRRSSTNIFLKLSIWASYLGADWVAVYALGYMSGHEDVPKVVHISRRTQPLSFYWAPFLLIHLGGQDTITAFSMEDNHLWLRHLLNLVVQVVLALFVFWKSIGRHRMELLVSCFFLFISGGIKYGERTWSLKCGSSKSLESSSGDQYKQRLPEVTDSKSGYSKIVLDAIRSMPNVLNVFAERNLFGYSSQSFGQDAVQDTKRMLKVTDLELGMMYDDLYTKALVLRRKIGVVLRCISHISVLVAFVLFLAIDKQGYSTADVAITYSLFIGGFLLDFSAMFIFIMSPWTWVWLKARKWDRLAGLSWFLFSSDIGVPEKKPRWSNSIGQYNLVNRVSGRVQSSSCNQQVMSVVKRLGKLVGAGNEISKLSDTQYVEADEKTIEFVIKGIIDLRDEFAKDEARKWPNLGPFLEKIRASFVADFGAAIVEMHMFTEVYLNGTASAPGATDMVKVCRKLSNYMMYLFVTQPSMLPLNASSDATLAEYAHFRGELSGIEPSKETLDEMVYMWTRLLIYSAGKSRGEMHAAQLTNGGELITFIWLLMVKLGLGDSQAHRILIANSFGGDTNLKEAYAFYFSH